jgi:DNA-binding PadR family transcriptional regulator
MPDAIRPTRATRRVLLVLLTGAPDLDGFTISHLAGMGSGRTYLVLHRLERAGWVMSEWGGLADTRPHRRYRHLTRQGRAKATLLLGLPPGEPSARTEDGDA